MRVAINGRFWDKPTTGVERFAQGVTLAIDQLLADGDECVGGLSFEIIRPRNSEVECKLKKIREIRVGRTSGHVWEQTSLGRAARGAVLLNLCNTGPLSHSQSISCVHDAHVWLVEENFTWAFRSFYKIVLPVVLRRSARWTTVSKFSGEALQRVGAAVRPPDAITPNGVDHILNVKPSGIRGKNSCIPERYVLCLGSRSKNKNFGLIERVHDRLSKIGLSVVVAGGNNTVIFRSGDDTSRGFISLGRVTDEELKYLYQNSIAFLFPSLHEGFGIPPLEAMALKCPVISSNASALPETVGDGAVLCDPLDADAWVDAVYRLANDSTFRAEIISRGFAQAQKYRWSNTARAFINLVRTLQSVPDGR